MHELRVRPEVQRTEGGMKLRDVVNEVLVAMDGCSLDSAEDRERVAQALVERLERRGGEKRMPKKKKKPKVSVAMEVETLMFAMGAVASLIDVLCMHKYEGWRDRERIHWEAAGMLALLGERMKMLERAVRGEIDAELLRAPHNKAVGAEGELVLVPRK